MNNNHRNQSPCLAFKLLSSLLAVLAIASPAFAAAPTREQNDLALRLQQDRTRLQATDVRLREARAAFMDVPAAKASLTLALAKMAFDTVSLDMAMNAKPDEATGWLDKGEHYLAEATMSLVPSRGAEVRAMLIDAGSLPKTDDLVVKLVDKLADAHFNMLVPEVYRRGYTIYPSTFTERDPEFGAGPDVLKTLIRQAHLRGLEVQPWIWTFRARSPGFGNPILGRLPALGAHTDGKETRFLAAASPEAREFVYGLVDELAARYDIDGLMLDYIRFDEEIPEDDISKTRFSLDYKARHGALPPFPFPPHTALAVEWQLWREQQVNTSVQEIARELHARNPRFPIGAAIFRGETYARLNKMQHWRHWANNRWIDWPSPMLYTAQNEELAKWLDWETDHHTRDNLIYPILGVHRMATRGDLVDQIQELHAENIPGFMVFALAHFDLTLLDELRDGPFRDRATLPHRNLVRATRKVLAQSAHYLTRVFTEGDFEAAATARMLYGEVIAIAGQLPLNELPYYQNAALVARIKSVQELGDFAPWPEAARKEFRHELDYAISLARANQFQLEHTRFSPTSLPPIQVHDEPARGKGE
jgi:uncharacterized lipoprotein YddW (UPF0748 family)